MPTQHTLIDDFDAYRVAETLNRQLTEAAEPFMAFTAFMFAMQEDDNCTKSDQFEYLEIVGLGLITECWVWWLKDGSAVITGWKAQDELAVGVLPPGADFTPITLTSAGNGSIH